MTAYNRANTPFVMNIAQETHGGIGKDDFGKGDVSVREILFRGKRLDNGGWVYGDLLQSKYSSGDYKTSIMEQTPVALNFPVYPETVGQYTGLKDKNGVKIYEGDILRVTDDADEINEQNSDTGIGEVTWLDKWLLWYISNVNNGLGDLNYSGYLEVIGNCHDNPEFLEV